MRHSVDAFKADDNRFLTLPRQKQAKVDHKHSLVNLNFHWGHFRSRYPKHFIEVNVSCDQPWTNSFLWPSIPKCTIDIWNNFVGKCKIKIWMRIDLINVSHQRTMFSRNVHPRFSMIVLWISFLIYSSIKISWVGINGNTRLGPWVRLSHTTTVWAIIYINFYPDLVPYWA